MAQRRLLDLAVHVRQKNMIMPSHQLEVIARYQTTLDNQLYKALRALRDEQEARLETLEAMAEPVDAVAS